MPRGEHHTLKLQRGQKKKDKKKKVPQEDEAERAARKKEQDSLRETFDLLNLFEPSIVPLSFPEDTEPAVPIELNGGIMEGGGQILRLSVGLAAILQKPITIRRIRAGRAKPGLLAQHLTGIQSVAGLWQRSISGDKALSDTVTYVPGPFCLPASERRPLSANIGTAGSITLLLQTLIPPFLLAAPLPPQPLPPAPSEIESSSSSSSSSSLPAALGVEAEAEKSWKLELGGGTDVSNSPQMDFALNLLRPTLAKMGLRFDVDVDLRGFYPRGGGRVSAKLYPVRSVQPINLTDRGEIVKISINVWATRACKPSTSQHLAQLLTKGAQKIIRTSSPPGAPPVPIQEKFSTYDDKAYSNSFGGMIIAETSTGCLIEGTTMCTLAGKEAKSIEDAAEEAINMFDVHWKSGCCTGEFLTDQLIIFMALASGRSSIRTLELSLHTQTAIFFSETLTGVTFDVARDPDLPSTFLISVDGINHSNPNIPPPA